MGEVFIVPGNMLYTRWGDWFGWTMVRAPIISVVVATLRKINKICLLRIKIALKDQGDSPLNN